jgi:hypothetical protein
MTSQPKNTSIDLGSSGMVRHSGGCHCGRVRFEVSECNCSICSKAGFLHLIVPADRFALLCGSGDLSIYAFNTGVAKHTFCSHCGVKSFYTPRSHPDGVSVNARCIDSETIESMSVTPFDGRNWERARPGLAGSDET